jgi:hypothetical protein
MTSAITPHAAERVRCSDADRERTSDRLRTATAEGYLTMDELEERLSGAYAARYGHELDALVADLPDPTPRQTAPGWRAVLLMGLRQLGADVALLLGRGGVGWNRRRVMIAVLAALFAAGVVIVAIHGFGGDAFEHRGFDPPGVDGPGHHL